MYTYTGKIAEIAQLVDAVNSANAAGQVYPVSINAGGYPVVEFQEHFQQLNIASMSQKDVSPRVYVERWKKPAPKRPSLREKARDGSIVVSEHTSGLLRYEMRTIPKKNGTRRFVRKIPNNRPFSINSYVFLPVATFRGHPVVQRDPSYVKEIPMYGWWGRWWYDGTDTSWGEIIETPDDDLILEVDNNAIPHEPMPLLHLRGDPDWTDCLPATTECGNRLVEAEMDLLTTLAEMRDTVEGLASNVIRFTDYVRDMLRYSKLSRTTKRNLDLIEEFNSTLDVGSRAQYRKAIRRQKRLLEKQKERATSSLRKKYKNNGAEPVDRLTSHWLDAQYGIQPVVLTIDDLLATLQERKRNYTRSRVAWQPRFEPLQLDGWSVTDSSSAVGYVWGKSRMDLSSFYGSLTSYGRLNLPLTAWERVPLSFVVDWVLPIGDILSSLDFGGNASQRLFTRSFKRDINILMVKETESARFEVTVTGYVYARVYHSIDESILQLWRKPTPQLSWENWVSAFSLLWSKARGISISERILK